MKIEVKSREGAKSFSANVPWAAISIATYSDEFPELSRINRRALLQIDFADVTKPEDTKRIDALVGKQGSRFFNANHAHRILDFYARMCGIDQILVHCEQGYSRSPAVAAILHRISDGTSDQLFFQDFDPNRHVYNLLLEVARDRQLLT
ncbi:hypothetical protein [Bremerella sp. P1]|uniref:hypothetical protein n=1 Tax=Bremerella sp. P1 TaxID=3026424 RepID=UPI002368A4F8|nr:hypothetical protein [Bremerella sp. P1]WDI42036.1 hypothetical protein PSR63_26645 [Bremerella sp. P1]